MARCNCWARMTQTALSRHCVEAVRNSKGAPMTTRTFRGILASVQGYRCGFLLAALLPAALAAVDAQQPTSPEALWKKLEPFARPPEDFAGKFGPYRSPLKFADGSVVKTAADWPRRREEILKTWHKRLGSWPPLVEKPALKKLAKVERDGYTEFKVQEPRR